MNFVTFVSDDHIYHLSTTNDALTGQPNKTFGHITPFFIYCTFCKEVQQQTKPERRPTS